MRSSGSSTLHFNRKWRVEFHLDRATLSNFTNIHFPTKEKGMGSDQRGIHPFLRRLAGTLDPPTMKLD